MKRSMNSSKRNRHGKVHTPHPANGRLRLMFVILAVILSFITAVWINIGTVSKKTSSPREELGFHSQPHPPDQTELHPQEELNTVSPFGNVTWRPPGQSVEELFAHYAPLTPHALAEIADEVVLLNESTASSVDASERVLRALPNLLPPGQRRDYIMQQIHTILSFGPRVAGSHSTGQKDTLNFIVREAQWRPPREVLFREDLFLHEKVTDTHWHMEWDNFTAITPLGERSFANIVFTFQGGIQFSHRKRKQRRKRRVKSRESFDAIGAESVSQREALEYVVFAAHWDSKLYSDFEFLGASDAVVPVVYLLETMRLISTLTDTAAALRLRRSKGQDALDDCKLLTDVLSREYLALLRYTFASDEGFLQCLQGTYVNDTHVLPQWRKLLQLVEYMPAISIIFFDGEEAFVEWKGMDHTYGSRHMAAEWKKQKSPFASHNVWTSRFDSIDLFVLYDLMGNAGSQFHNYFPDQSGPLFARLVELEHQRRLRAEALYYPKQKLNLRQTRQRDGEEDEQVPNSIHRKSTQTKANENVQLQDESDATLLRAEMTRCLQHMPQLWCKYSPSHVMYTLHGVPRLFGPLQRRDDVEKLWIHPNLPRWNADTNIFFPRHEAHARGAVWRKGFHVEDDHMHWTETGRVLHLIPLPFPLSWHTARDNSAALDAGTIHDMYEVLMDFTMLLGNEWIAT